MRSPFRKEEAFRKRKGKKVTILRRAIPKIVRLPPLPTKARKGKNPLPPPRRSKTKRKRRRIKRR